MALNRSSLSLIPRIYCLFNPFAAVNASGQPWPGVTDALARPGAKAALRKFFDLFLKKNILSPKMMLGT